MLLADVEVGEQRVVLEDHVHRPLVGRVGRHVAVAQQDPTGGRQLEAADHPQRGRLAAAGRSEEREELPGADLERHAVDRPDLAEALLEADESDLRGSGAGDGHRTASLRSRFGTRGTAFRPPQRTAKASFEATKGPVRKNERGRGLRLARVLRWQPGPTRRRSSRTSRDVRKERVMNLLHPEYYERARRSELLHEAEAERLANLARRTSVRRRPSRDAGAPRRPGAPAGLRPPRHGMIGTARIIEGMSGRLVSPVVVGREREIATISRVLDDALAGNASPPARGGRGRCRQEPARLGSRSRRRGAGHAGAAWRLREHRRGRRPVRTDRRGAPGAPSRAAARGDG